MANEQNLRPFTKENPPSSEEAKKNGSKGGKKRAANARARKAYAEHLRELLDLPMDSHNKPRDFCRSKSAGDVKNYGVTVEQATIQALVNKAMKGDIKAIELVLKITGQMPDEKHDVTITAADPKDMSLEELARKLRQDDE